MGLNERLIKAYKEIGVTFDPNVMPSSGCAMVEAGFCSSQGKCYTDTILDGQADDGGLDDSRLQKSAQNMTDTAIAKGCNVIVKG